MRRYVPLNPQEHSDRLRTLILGGMPYGEGNPSTWVMRAVEHAFDQGVILAMDSVPHDPGVLDAVWVMEAIQRAYWEGVKLARSGVLKPLNGPRIGNETMPADGRMVTGHEFLDTRPAAKRLPRPKVDDVTDV